MFLSDAAPKKNFSLNEKNIPAKISKNGMGAPSADAIFSKITATSRQNVK
jgi:hypothetical protein